MLSLSPSVTGTVMDQGPHARAYEHWYTILFQDLLHTSLSLTALHIRSILNYLVIHTFSFPSLVTVLLSSPRVLLSSPRVLKFEKRMY